MEANPRAWATRPAEYRAMKSVPLRSTGSPIILPHQTQYRINRETVPAKSIAHHEVICIVPQHCLLYWKFYDYNRRMLRLYNTLTRKKEEFQTLEPDVVKLYVCGVTVYNDAHVGHAMSAIVFDIIRRYLESVSYTHLRAHE